MDKYKVALSRLWENQFRDDMRNDRTRVRTKLPSGNVSQLFISYFSLAMLRFPRRCGPSGWFIVIASLLNIPFIFPLEVIACLISIVSWLVWAVVSCCHLPSIAPSLEEDEGEELEDGDGGEEDDLDETWGLGLGG